MFKNWKTYLAVCLIASVLLGCQLNTKPQNNGDITQAEQTEEQEVEDKTVRHEEQRKKAEANTKRRERAKREEERAREKEAEELDKIEDITADLQESYGEYFLVVYNSDPGYSKRRVIEMHPRVAEGERLMQSLLVVTIASGPGEINEQTEQHIFNLQTYEDALKMFSVKSLNEIDDLEYAIMHPENPDSAMFIAYEGEILIGYEDWIQGLQGQISE